MSLRSPQFEAFLATARHLNVTRAAKTLSITQSALSQRLTALEQELGTILFVREPRGMRLTPQGENLLRHATMVESLDQSLLQEFKSTDTGLTKAFGGIIRIAGFSSVNWSVILPSLAPMLMEHPSIKLEAMAREIRELPSMLRSGEVDFIITDHVVNFRNIRSTLLGHEANVWATAHRQKTSPKASETIFLDHDVDDRTTELFLAHNRLPRANLQRRFLDDIHGILAGLQLGIGDAILPQHVLEKNSKIFVYQELKALEVPVYLSYFEQPFYNELHHRVVEIIQSGAAKILV